MDRKRALNQNNKHRVQFESSNRANHRSFPKFSFLSLKNPQISQKFRPSKSVGRTIWELPVTDSDSKQNIQASQAKSAEQQLESMHQVRSNISLDKYEKHQPHSYQKILPANRNQGTLKIPLVYTITVPHPTPTPHSHTPFTRQKNNN